MFDSNRCVLAQMPISFPTNLVAGAPLLQPATADSRGKGHGSPQTSQCQHTQTSRDGAGHAGLGRPWSRALHGIWQRYSLPPHGSSRQTWKGQDDPELCTWRTRVCIPPFTSTKGLESLALARDSHLAGQRRAICSAKQTPAAPFPASGPSRAVTGHQGIRAPTGTGQGATGQDRARMPQRRVLP